MAEDLLFQEAVEALRQGNKVLAREKLTLLLKAEQNNATYWVWMSAAVGSAKERIYCLQTAFKLDPENAAARRGLILLGALPPDETIPPFQVNHPRAWEQKLLLTHEQPRLPAWKAFTANPLTRLAGMSVLGVALCGLAILGMSLPRAGIFSPFNTNTPGPSPTFTLTPTFVNATGQPAAAFIGPTPLWMLLPATYTPTPQYVNTPRRPESSDLFRAAKAAFDAADWETYIGYLEDIAVFEPEAADIYYQIGEAYRFQGFHQDALETYNHALEIDPAFGPAYLGLARARLMQDPNVNVEYLFDEALNRDPEFGEVYLVRAQYFLYHKDYGSALADLQAADKRMPDSALVYLTYARVYLARKDTTLGLEAARKANDLDLTLLPGYLVRGQAAVSQEEYEESIEALETYIVYEPQDGSAYAYLGESYFKLKKYEQAIAYLDKAIPLLDFSPLRHNSYLYRGLSHLELDEMVSAEYDLEKAYEVFPESFDVNIGLVQMYYSKQEFGNAFLKAYEAESLAESDEQLAQVYYWRALAQEKRNATGDAIQDWNDLLDLPGKSVSPAMRAEAQNHLKSLATATPTPRNRTTPTRTPTPKAAVTRTPTRTPTPTATPGP